MVHEKSQHFKSELNLASRYHMVALIWVSIGLGNGLLPDGTKLSFV